jgi:hypothetical protein
MYGRSMDTKRQYLFINWSVYTTTFTIKQNTKSFIIYVLVMKMAHCICLFSSRQTYIRI